MMVPRSLLLLAALLAALPSAATAARVTLKPVGRFDQPVHVTAPPGDISRVFVVERRGTIRVVRDGRRQERPFLDIRRRVAQPDGITDERGLLSMAFSPDFATTGRFYVYYTRTRDGRADANTVVVDEYRARGSDARVVEPRTRREIIAIQTGRQHFGGQLAFGPDGRLWLGPGDGRGPGDPDRQAHDRRTLRGKLLRIDPRPGRSLAPRGNPYRRPAGAALVWAYGLRNPYRFSFDRLTGDLVIGDVGQNFAEEIDFVTRADRLGRGGNFGWSRLEGRFLYRRATPSALRPATRRQLPDGYIAPAIEHLHRAGWCAITGGHVVRDPELPELYGRYVYGDFCRGVVMSARLVRTARALDVRTTRLRVDLLSSFGEDGCGRVYVASLRGPVFRLASSGRCAGPAPSPFPVAPAARPGPEPPGLLPWAERVAVLFRSLFADSA
jgi:glucose/arabinose dehydrogenase